MYKISKLEILQLVDREQQIVLYGWSFVWVGLKKKGGVLGDELREVDNIQVTKSFVYDTTKLELYLECYRVIEELWTEKFKN